MTKQRIRAILSDYDGTLVPTAHMKNPKTNSVPKELEQVLNVISSEIPVCIISTKDFEFLGNKAVFARVLSCMMGIETVVLGRRGSQTTIQKRGLHTHLADLRVKSEALEAIAEAIRSQEEFSGILVERKHTSDGVLAGLTADWRSLTDWSQYSASISHFISRMVAALKKPPVPVNLYVQKYRTHPFIDVYSTECNKGMAFDTVLSELADTSLDGSDILYLGDSENDNAAFRKAGISIGIRSDVRVNPKLDCSYFLKYEELSSFLMNLRKNDYLFTNELLVGREA